MAMPVLTIYQIIHTLELEPLPAEGGLYRQSYRSRDEIPGQCLPGRYGAEVKPFGTAIYYLLTNDPGSFSAFHRLPTDEVIHFYLGDPLEITLLFPSGESQQVFMGQDILHGQRLQSVVPAGVWQGSRVAAGGCYALIGTTMAPGYTQSDLELGVREALLAQYPEQRQRILQLTR